MSYWILKQFDKREVGTDMSHLDISTAEALVEKGILTKTKPNSEERPKETTQEAIDFKVVEVPEVKQFVKPAQTRGRKPNKK